MKLLLSIVGARATASGLSSSVRHTADPLNKNNNMFYGGDEVKNPRSVYI